MPSKLQNTVSLYNETLKEISRSPENWASFLITASNNYKYNFANQVLIFVQRPDATACADIDTWNKKVKRWVNKGAKGIALLEENSGKNYLKYVFDVSDTHNYRSTNLNLWKIDERYQKNIIESLEAQFGDLENKSNLTEAIISASYNSVEDNLQDYLSDLITSKEDSLLEELDDFNIEVKFRTLLSNSVAFATMQRCEINPFDYFSLDDFQAITEFNTLDTISRIGTATSDIAENNLREIHSTITKLKNQEKNINRTFVENKKVDDNIIKENERSVNYEYNIQSGRGLSNTKYNDRGEERESNSRQILSNEVKLSEGTQKRPIYGFNDEKRTYKSSSRNTKISNRENGINNQRFDEESEYNRRIESTRPNEMGANDEQLERNSRRDNNSRIDLQLDLPTEEEQKNIIADISNEDVPAIFDFTQEMIDRTLQNGSGFAEGKFRIYRQMTSSLSSEENIKFLKKEYGIGGASLAYSDAEISQWHDAKGIRLYKGYDDNRPEKLLNWNYVEKRIRELVLNDRYLNPKEFDEYLVWLERDTAEKFNTIKEIPVEKVLDYHLGDIVYIGANQFEISNIDLFDIQLHDLSFPLLSQEMSIDKFEQILRDNPLNEHLFKIKQNESKIIPYKTDINKNYKLNDERYFHFHTNEEGFYYEIYDNKGNEIDGGLLEYSEIDNTEQTILEIRKRISDLSGIEEIGKDELEEVSQEVIDNLKDGINIGYVEQAKKVLNLFEKREENGKPLNRDEYYKEQEKINYHITDNKLGEGTPKERFKNNIEAIKVLKNCEDDNRLATKEEQEILAKYVGWGGLSKAFDNNDSSWSNEYNTLKDLLTEEEYKNARASTLTAFYTPPVVIKSMYKALENIGVKNANILEPSCGTGNFLGSIPDTMNESKLYGIEIDSISGRIARQLYQNANIVINGYEKTDLPDSFFDVSIGNVPFGDFKLNDKRYDKNNFLIHDYFFR